MIRVQANKYVITVNSKNVTVRQTKLTRVKLNGLMNFTKIINMIN